MLRRQGNGCRGPNTASVVESAQRPKRVSRIRRRARAPSAASEMSPQTTTRRPSGVASSGMASARPSVIPFASPSPRTRPPGAGSSMPTCQTAIAAVAAVQASQGAPARTAVAAPATAASPRISNTARAAAARPQAACANESRMNAVHPDGRKRASRRRSSAWSANRGRARRSAAAFTKPRLRVGAKPHAAAVDARLRGLEGDLEQLGHLLVGISLDVAEDDRHADRVG